MGFLLIVSGPRRASGLWPHVCNRANGSSRRRKVPLFTGWRTVFEWLAVLSVYEEDVSIPAYETCVDHHTARTGR